MMNGDSYKIIISLSHHRIAYEYWQRDGENKLVGMPNGKWPAPLVFYCTDNGIIIGDDALRAARSGTVNAFGNYFELLVEDGSYSLNGQNRPIRNMLIDASEAVFRDFFRQVLLNQYGSFSDNRAVMPLTLVCESDVQPYETALLKRLFKDRGYARVMVLDYQNYIAQYVKEALSKEYVCDKVLVAWTEGEDLTFTLFDVVGDNTPVKMTYKGLGVDPRMEYVKKLIKDCLVGQNSFINYDKEVDEIVSKEASDFLATSIPMKKGTIRLAQTPGYDYFYSLNRNQIDCIGGSDGESINDKLNEFLRENNITNRSRVLMLLRGMAAGNTYFEQNLSHGFVKTIKSDRKLRENTMRLILSVENPVPNSSGPIPPPIDEISQDGPDPDLLKAKLKKWREIKASAKGKVRSNQNDVALQMLKDFKSECEVVSGAEDLLKQIEKEISGLEAKITVDVPAKDDKSVKELECRWREVKAAAKGKDRSGNTAEAISLLTCFEKEVQKVPQTESLMALISSELSAIWKRVPKPVGCKHKDGDIHPNGKWVWVSSLNGGKGDWRTLAGPKHQEAIKEAKTLNHKDEADGHALVHQGKLKEARDWFRSSGDLNMAKVLTDIIRSRKGIDKRKDDIEECRKTKDKNRIGRIVAEIRDFIALCEKADVNTAEYKKLLSEYKKI